MAAQTVKLLDIAPSLQWENANGFCGETSVLEACLYHGCYASQAIIRRDLAGSEVLLEKDEQGPGNIAVALRKLKLRYTWYDTDSPAYNSNWQKFVVWMKREILQGHMVIHAQLVSDGDQIGYDHIVPTTGISTLTPTSTAYDGRDIVTMHTLFDLTPVRRTFASLPARGGSCKYDLDHGGCIPMERQYGTSVLGIVDTKGETRPVQIYLNKSDEPNTTLGQAPITYAARVVVRGLTVGKTYALLRYNNLAKVPDYNFKSSGFVSKIQFKATASTYTYITTIASNSVVVFRCVDAW
eukprot:comp10472_c0_seq1/m.5219 comp10472_c0_seq1/g.5219  ORF comp10472_c0_seq1/g.5219 comp10472_c0_seq1/m.5219 type:complete len:296 (-) comp10472_c0_seq1:124-1011(-)